VFHNRLTHSIEVAQVARRVAEKFQTSEGVAGAGGIDPDVVEAAGLAHDLGHPPFGHIAETRLSELVDEKGSDGFEGNAQTFRILTRLTAHRRGYRGLNLTRATLNAVLKYPWPRDPAGFRHKKFGVYEDDRMSFDFVRDNVGRKSLEAEIMDFADDVAYSVHDFDDFYRAGLIPLELLVPLRDAKGKLVETEEFIRVIDSWVAAGKAKPAEAQTAREPIYRLLDLLKADSRYEGTFEQRVDRRTSSAVLIGRYVSAVALDLSAEEGHRIRIDRNMELALSFLRFLLWHYVINNPRLATQQAGQRQIIGELFARYYSAITDANLDLVPAMFRDIAQQAKTEMSAARLASDIVASFTDSQAETMYRRFIGVESGSVLDLLER
jgi:dGTPase